MQAIYEIGLALLTDSTIICTIGGLVTINPFGGASMETGKLGITTITTSNDVKSQLQINIVFGLYTPIFPILGALKYHNSKY